jgi:glucose/arabinose dehydrogenase
MQRFLLALLGPPAFLGAVLLTILWYFRPPATPWHWLVAAVLLLAGGLATIRRWGWRWLAGSSAVSLGAAAFVAWALWNGSLPLMDPPFEGEGNGLVPTTVRIPSRLPGTPPSGLQTLRVLPGLNLSLFAAGLDRPRMLAFSPAGDLYVSLPGSGRVAVLPDRDGDGVADEVKEFVAGLDRPHGLAFAGADLVVAENGRLVRLPDRDGDLAADGVEVLSTDLPGGGGHWTRSVAVGPDGHFYVAAGSSCNVCIEDDPRRAAIMRIAPSGGPAQIFARGLRNSVGLSFHPDTGELWASDNGRDWLGDHLPPEEINRIVADGDYGWPYCYGQRVPDPDFGGAERCADSRLPAVEMPAHSAPLGVAFGHGLDFPAPYRAMLYVAFHGSWNRSVPTGYKLIGIPFRDGRPSGPPEDIVSGWLRDHSVWGRPVAPVAGPDGALYLSDDRAGVIYRLHSGTPAAF